ncbi:MAG: hypothetical protein MUF85_02310 [Patescibacteria group bacterium]|jgi:hypothetical protein|nr:hypothetical protein [Patescibacteria group bacterium]
MYFLQNILATIKNNSPDTETDPINSLKSTNITDDWLQYIETPIDVV